MQLDSIFNRARGDLVIRTERGEEDLFLWEHSVRVARNAEQIVALGGDEHGAVDLAAVVAAALYHDAAWILRLRSGSATRAEILLRPLDSSDREEAAVLMQRTLHPILPPETLSRAAAAVQEFSQRDTASVEAWILAEAEALEEFGLHSLWVAIRRGVGEGKGLSSTLETWQRRREYRFWDARLKDSFRTPAVRAVAQRRLEALERFMADLREQVESTDLAQMSTERVPQRTGRT